MLSRMPGTVASIAPLAASLDERAALLARLLDSHPARHLLAEYEAVLLDRRPCVDRRSGDETRAAHRLLTAMDKAIAELKTVASQGRSGG
jgi:hypothetical protein